LRRIIVEEIIPTVAARLAPAPQPAPQPEPEDDVMELIQVPGDPAVFLRDGLVVTWVQSEAVRDALLADGTLKSAAVRPTQRLTLKAYELHGPLPNAGPTTGADFAKHVP
jgi:hypothetical protein